MLVYGRYRGLGQVDASGVAGGVAAAESAENGAGQAGQAIFVGVATGVLVWTITRILDRVLGFSSSRGQ